MDANRKKLLALIRVHWRLIPPVVYMEMEKSSHG